MIKPTNIALGLFICSAISLSSCGHKNNKDAHEQIPSKVSVVQPIEENLNTSIHSSGIITNSNEITLSFKNPGIVSTVLVNEGDYVLKGQLLAKMESPDLEAQLQQLNFKAGETERDLKRYSKLLKDTIVTLQQFQQTQTVLENTRSQQQAIRYNIETMSLYAPESGVVLKKNINSGEYKSASSPVITLGNNEKNIRWAFRFSVTDQERLKLKIGQQIKIKLDANTEISLTATIFKMMSLPNASAGTYDIYASIQGEDNNLIYGLTGKVLIELADTYLYTKIPLSSLFDVENGKASFYWIDQKNIVQKETVSIVTVQDKSVYLKEKFPADRKIVTEGGNTIKEGERVTITTN